MRGWRNRLRAAFEATLAELSPEALMAPVLARWRDRATDGAPFLVIAFGKAARPMARALADGLPGAALRGLVVPPEPDDAPLPPFEVIPGGHPLPTAGSLRAARRALELARSAGPDDTVLFLASGGGSAMLELPAEPTTSLEELRTCYRELVGSGADIVDLNIVRRHLSAVKGGRLALAAARAGAHVTLEISDVPEREHALVASGPSHPDPTSPADARAVLDRHGLWSVLPPNLAAALRREQLPPRLELFQTDDTARSFVTLGSNRLARACMARELRRAGALVVDDPSVDDWPYARAAAHLLGRLDRLRRRHPGRPVAIVSGGELSVPLTASPGVGGRNQQFALALARLIRGRPIVALSCGTDGVDGNSSATGAIVDGTTIARARRAGFDPGTQLAAAAAFPLLDAIGDVVITGPTGTNVRDLRVLLAAR